MEKYYTVAAAQRQSNGGFYGHSNLIDGEFIPQGKRDCEDQFLSISEARSAAVSAGCKEFSKTEIFEVSQEGDQFASKIVEVIE